MLPLGVLDYIMVYFSVELGWIVINVANIPSSKINDTNYYRDQPEIKLESFKNE